MKYIVIEGRAFLWRSILELRRQQRKAARQPPQPTLFELHEDCRPQTQLTAAGRFSEPLLFEENQS